MSMLNLGSLGGWLALATLAWIIGGTRRPIPWRTLRGASALIFTLGALVFLLPPTRIVLLWINDFVLALLGATLATLMTGALAGVFYVGQAGILGL